MVSMVACSSSYVARFGFLLTKAPPVTAHQFKCLTPQVTKFVSESGLNSPMNMRLLCPAAQATLVPSRERMYC